MTRGQVIHMLLEGQRPPYVPWSFGFTQEPRARLEHHYGRTDLADVLHNHLLGLGSGIGFCTDIGDNLGRDVWGQFSITTGTPTSAHR